MTECINSKEKLVTLNIKYPKGNKVHKNLKKIIISS